MAYLYLIRHGEPRFHSGKKTCIGATDIPLSAVGQRQMKKLQRFIEESNIRKIYVSPLCRSKQSGAILSNDRIPVIEMDSLREIHMGRWDGLSFEEIRQSYPEEYYERGKDFADYQISNGETFRQCQERAVNAYKEILSHTEDENIAIVGHVGFFRALISFLEGRDLQRVMDINMPYGDVYAWDIGPSLGAVIVAAGLSSRMNALKPIMKWGEENFLTHELNVLSRAGVRNAVVVTGRDAQRVESAVEGPGVRFVYNANYKITKMFYSALLGIKGIPGESQGIFFLPADTPAFSLYSLLRLREAFLQRDYEVFRPTYLGEPGHPLLIRNSYFGSIFSYRGDGGLRGLLGDDRNKVLDVSVPEQGVLMDADTPSDYKEILSYEHTRRMPDAQKCLELLRWMKLSPGVINHSVAVAKKAVEMAEEYNQRGGQLKIPLVQAAALLHDIAAGQPKHHKTGALWLRQMGLDSVATAMENHSYLPEKESYTIDEAAIVFLADKLCLGTAPCSIEQRYRHRLREYEGDAQAEAAILARAKQAETVYALYRDTIGQKEE